MIVGLVTDFEMSFTVELMTIAWQNNEKIKKKKGGGGQNGPGSLTWIFDVTLAIFFSFPSLSEKNLQEFLFVCTVQVARIHYYYVYWQIKTSQTILEKVTQETFLWNYFKIWPVVSGKTVF